MVNGLELFRDRFRAFEGAFTLIGGAACDQWSSILASLKESIGTFRAESLRNAIQTYFRLPSE